MATDVSVQTEALIRERVASGRYAAAAAVDEAVRLLDGRDKRQHLRALIDEADAAIERGETVDGTSDLFAQLKQEAEEARRRGIPVARHVKP